MPARIILDFVLLLLAVTSVDGGSRPGLTVNLSLDTGSSSLTLPSIGDELNLTCRVLGARSDVTVVWSRQLPGSSQRLDIRPEVPSTLRSPFQPPEMKYTQMVDTSTAGNQRFTLVVHDLSYRDDGIYFCRAEADNKNATGSWNLTLEAKPEVTTFQAITNGLIGYEHEVQVQVAARPPVTSVEWFGPSGYKLNTSSQKYHIREFLDSVYGEVTLHITNFSRDDSGEYRVVMTNEKGSTEAVVEVNAIERVNMRPPDPFVDVVSRNSSLMSPKGVLTFPHGSTAVFICRACNFNREPTFSWYHGKSRTDLSSLTATNSVSVKVNSTRMGTTESTVTIRGITYDFIGELVCVASESGPTYDASTNIDVVGAPVVQSSMRTVRGGINDQVELGCNVTANPPPTLLKWLFNKEVLGFQSYSNDTPIDKTLEMRHVVEVTSSADYGSYMCQVTNRYGTIGYSINVVGPLQINPSEKCPETPCTNYKVCDEDSNACVCPPGKTALGNGMCKVTSIPYTHQQADGYLWIGVGAGSVLIVTVVMGVILFVCWKRRSDLTKKKAKKDELNMVSAAYSHAQYATANIYEVITRPADEFPRERLKFFHPLGVGKFGRVMKAEALSINKTGKWEEVAVKMCQESATDLDKEDLYNELVIIRKIPKHINVVSFYGACTYGEPLLIILEYVPGGDLRNYLRRKRPDYDKVWESPNSEGDSPLGTEIQTVDVDDGELTAKDLLSFALQAAKGMQHLEMNNIVHRDVAARNVLIGYNGVCKVSDFGLARDVEGVDVYERTSKGPLPVRWMSPESLMEGSHSHKADVWAFGILLWEIVTLGASPYSTLTLRAVIDSVMAGKRLERPQHCMDELYSLMCRCWDQSPKDRPEFSEVSKQLEYLLEKEADYIQLDQFQEAVYMVLEPDSTEEKL